MGNFATTGEFKNTLDEKGRIMFPAKIRAELSDSNLVITRSVDNCLWLFTPDKWKKFSDKLMESASLFKAESRSVMRRLIAPAQEIEIDKNGRISIPQSLREFAGLEKDCIILGLRKCFELWDLQQYEKYLKESEPDFSQASEALGEIGF